MRYKIASITHIIRLPAICALCNQYHTNNMAICTACINLFTPIGPACRHCAQPLPDANFLICGQCIQKKPVIDEVFTAYRFEEPLRTLLHEFKYRNGLYLSSCLTTLMLAAHTHEKYKTQCLIPVPMHHKRLRQRGFNQAAELAKQLSRTLNLNCDLTYVKKIKNTPPQAGLNATDRQKNLKHAFTAKATDYDHVTIIDDLLTTGSTANEIAHVLKQQGVSRVDLWCCARVALDETEPRPSGSGISNSRQN